MPLPWWARGAARWLVRRLCGNHGHLSSREIRAALRSHTAMYHAGFFIPWCIMQLLFWLIQLTRSITFLEWLPWPNCADLILTAGLPVLLFSCLLVGSRWLKRLARWLIVVETGTCILVLAWLIWAVYRLPYHMKEYVEFLIPKCWAAIQADDSLQNEVLGAIRVVEGRAFLWQILFFVHYLLDFLRTGYLHVASVLYGAMCLTMILITMIAPSMRIFYLDVTLFSLMSVVGYWFQGVHAHRVRRQLFQKHFEEQMDRLDELRRSEEKARVATALQDSAQQADGILNHILKNSMADAAGCVHLFLNSAVPDRLDLQKALECLARGMQWCHNRLALIHIAAGQYVPDLVVVELKHLVGEVVAGRPVQSDASASSVLLDPLLTQNVLGNVVDNAFRHGHTVDPHVTLTAHLCPLPRAANAPLSRRELVVEISNIADPDRPHVTEDLVTSVLQNRNRPMYPIIDNTDDPSALPPSDHVGLAEIFAAARAHGMNPTLSQVGDVVTFRASMEVTVVKSNSELSLTSLAAVAAATPMPSHPLSNLRFFVLDDSAIARRLLVQTLTTTVQPQSVKAYGATPEEVHDFRLEALQNADVLIVDQYLDYDGACFLGTTVIRQLLAEGFAGLVAIRSANVSRKDQLAYFSHGAHCVIGKDVPPKEMLDMIGAAYVQHVHLQRDGGVHSGGTRRRAEASSVPYRIWKSGSKDALPSSHGNDGVPIPHSLRFHRTDPRTTTYEMLDLSGPNAALSLPTEIPEHHTAVTVDFHQLRCSAPRPGPPQPHPQGNRLTLSLPGATTASSDSSNGSPLS